LATVANEQGKPAAGNESTAPEADDQPSLTESPAISLPKGGGAIKGIGEKFSVGAATGLATLDVPIATSEARASFGPKLSLAYNSGGGNGPFGFGWQLTLPSITRKTEKGLPQYRDAAESDVFIMSNTEDLTPAMVQAADRSWSADEFQRGAFQVKRYRPRVEGMFARIERWTRLGGDTHWRTLSKDNILCVYGWDLTSRIADPHDTSRIFSWLICQSYDDKGNAIFFEYAAEDNANVDDSMANERQRSRTANRYIKRIRYGNRMPLLIDPTNPSFRALHAPPPEGSTANWMFDLVFDYGEGAYQEQAPDAEGRVFASADITPPPGMSWPTRLDPFSSHRATFEIRGYRLCRRILTFHHFPDELGVADYLVRATELTYDQKPIGSFVTQIVQSGFKRWDDGHYLKRSLPPLDLAYTQSPLDGPSGIVYDVSEIDAESLRDLPVGLSDPYRWVDLDGEGIAGVLTEQAASWYFKPNLGGGHFAPLQCVTAQASSANLNAGHQALLDLGGEGQLDLVEFGPGMPGFYERACNASWHPFQTFQSFPNIPWAAPNVRLFDVTGDGIADLVVTEDECILWHPSLGEQGFGAGIRVPLPHDEEKGPWLIFADLSRTIFVADMTGDGLNDVVRIRNGEVCYWPNQGYGQFGAKVTMDQAPWLDAPDLFDPRRIRLVDTDGSGTTDMLYLGRDGIKVYLNQVGNGWSTARVLPNFPTANDARSVTSLDLLGRGTACIVWSSPLPGDARGPMLYVDLMLGVKPHLLASVRNNLGAETLVEYAASTEFYLADKAAGQAWVTRLPFPVHVVSRVDTYDRVGRNRSVARYTYHHGHFDGIEREFRGFGRVEQLDTDELATLEGSSDFSMAGNVDAKSYVPPVLTKSWFHTGASLTSVSRAFESEYFREDGANDAQNVAMQLTDTVLPVGLTADEWHQAYRSLKGSLLRREIYGLDESPAANKPYVVEENNYAIHVVQPRTTNRYGVFSKQLRESIHFDYERLQPADPRVQHRVTLVTDDFGNVLLSAFVAYGRRIEALPNPLLTNDDDLMQKASRVLFTLTTFSNVVSLYDAYRTPVPCESRSFELLNTSPASNVPGISNLYRVDELQTLISQASDGAHDIAFENTDGAGLIDTIPFRRLISNVRTIYRTNDLSATLALGQLQSLALPFVTHRLAITPGLGEQIYVNGGQLSAAGLDALLTGLGGYVHSEGDSSWWVPSHQLLYSPGKGDSSSQEFAYAQQHFFLARRYRDTFGNTSTVTYDHYDLLPLEIADALDNRVTAGTRDINGVLIKPSNDYRVLRPALVMDANRNRSAVAFDALGDVVGSAVMGKPEENLGDSLDGFDADLDDASIAAHLADPFANPQACLQRATTRTIVDMFAFARSELSTLPQPSVVYSMVRETHDSDLLPGQATPIQHRFAYSDGFGRQVQQKLQAGPGPLASGGPVVDRRWIANGWTIFNNKGMVVRQYEPFFDDAPAFRFGAQVGVSPIVLYDPVSRPAATIYPNHTWEKVIRTPWREERWDVNDTVLLDPKTDADVSSYVSRLPDGAYLPTWYTQRQIGSLGDSEQDSATKTAIHANTPEIAFFDAFGRAFLTIAHNRFKFTSDPSTNPPTDVFYRALIVFDIDGNERRIIDTDGRESASYDYDMLGNRLRTNSMEAGERRVLLDAGGLAIRAWDSRGHAFTMTYDSLRRPVLRSVVGTDPARSDTRTLAQQPVFEKMEYGEGLSADVEANLRTRLVRSSDSAGVVKTDLYDFKGNGLRTTQCLLHDYKSLADWSANPQLEIDVYINQSSFDALNRVQTLVTPDHSVAAFGYDAGNRLVTLAVNVRGAPATTSFILGVTYDAKGQRKEISYGNGTSTAYEYDALTFRLVRATTIRSMAANGIASQLFANVGTLQDLHYTYDPVGNVTEVTDHALQTTLFANQQVLPAFLYNYDATYRLIEAGGREHADQSTFIATSDGNFRDYPFAGALQLGNLKALRNYTERYDYDGTGNLTRWVHGATNGNWTRLYDYAEPSQIERTRMSNRLSQTSFQGNGQAAIIEPYSYDAHGCISQMPHLPLMQWDFKSRLSATSRQVVNLTPPPGKVPEMTYFSYSSSDIRVRKVVERQNGTRRSERIYLLNAELYREYGSDGQIVTLTRETLHVMDDRQRIAVIETNVSTEGGSGSSPLLRYQINNSLGSACIETDSAGSLISYEEFTPYGTAAFQAGRTVAEISLKRYRYTGKERDGETGFTYHGARYYAPWLARWVSCDPDGLIEQRSLASDRSKRGRSNARNHAFEHRSMMEGRSSWNLYRYARNNPQVYIDPTGRFDAKVLIPTAALAGAALTLGGLESTGILQTDGDKWVQGGESRLFDFWTFGHYLGPTLISTLITIALQNWTHLRSEDILAVSGFSTTAIALGYELIERPLWSFLHNASRPGTWFGDFDLGVISGRTVHENSQDAALEHRTNTVGDVLIGSIGAFTGSYVVLALYRRAPDSKAFWLWGGLGVATGVGLTAAVTYGGVFPTRETHYYDRNLDEFFPGRSLGPSDIVDFRYRAFIAA
jgi:RHS repeat-associated protein